MKNKEFIENGICIWCKKKAREVTFNNIPHIVPQALGCEYIGFDICDSCNSYFGTAKRGECNTNLIFSEVFKCFRLFTSNRDSNSWKSFTSSYFKYEHKKNKITIKKSFNVPTLTKQFKRSLYEVFLQKYHQETKRGLEAEMDFVRNYGRYGIGELKVYYLLNSVLCTPVEGSFFSIGKIDDIRLYGYYFFSFMGHFFILEIIPELASINKDSYINRCSKFIIKVTKQEEIKELDDIRILDFFMLRWSHKDIDPNNKLTAYSI